MTAPIASGAKFGVAMLTTALAVFVFGAFLAGGVHVGYPVVSSAISVLAWTAARR